MAESRKRNRAEEQAEKLPLGSDFCKLFKKMNGIPDGYKELFLRELVQNAFKALCLMRGVCLYGESKIDDPRGFFIDIIPDKINHTLSIVDNGIGMSEDCLKKKLFTTIPQGLLVRYNCTIDSFVKKELDVNEFYKIYPNFLEIGIGKFGLGFFAAYMVADTVEITTKRFDGGDKHCTFFSSPKVNEFFKVESCTVSSPSPPRGTKVTLHLNKDYFEYLDECRLKVLIDKYPFSICPYPISIRVNNNIIIQRLADLKEKNKDIDLVKREFEGTRIFIEKVIREYCGGFGLKRFLGSDGRGLERVIISDRIYDRATNLSLDYTTFEINPRSPLIKEIRKRAERNPEDQKLWNWIRSLYHNCMRSMKRHKNKGHIRWEGRLGF